MTQRYEGSSRRLARLYDRELEIDDDQGEQSDCGRTFRSKIISKIIFLKNLPIA